MLKIVHTINAFTAFSGGTSTCTYDLLSALNKGDTGVSAEIVVTDSKFTDVPLMGNGEPWIISVENDEKTAFCISANLRRVLMQTKADVFHTNGLWRYCNHITAFVARLRGKPYVISPHGMLYPQALTISKWKKRLLRWLFFDLDLSSAACIHVTCMEELEHVRELGFTNPIAVIGNPVHIPQIPIKKERTEKVTFGYLGRLHPIKRVERIIDALSDLSIEERKQCELLIIGTGEAYYENMLRERVRQFGLENVQFVGFVSGEKKEKILSHLSAVFVPSVSENFGMAIAESLACCTPVFASTGTPWRILKEKGCGWWQEASKENIVSVMRQIIAMDPKKLDEMGRNGRQLIEKQFSERAIAQKMAELYNWIITKKSTPSFVYE